MIPFFNKNYGNASSLHKKGLEAKNALEKARKIIAKKINSSPKEIIFTSSGTESNNLALKGVALYELLNGFKKTHIITTKIEHKSILNVCEFLKKLGFKVTYLRVDKEGFVDLEQLKRSISKKTLLVSIIHANNEIGTIQDLYTISKICKKHNVLLHSDAVQSFCKVEIDVKKINIDMLSFSAHKIHGPKGVGALYIKKGTKLLPLFHGGNQEFSLRSSTENIPGIVGFAKAVQIYKKQDINKMKKLRDFLIQELTKIKGVYLNGPRKNRLCNNANFCFKGIEAEALLLLLDHHNIHVSSASACSSHSLNPSHVLLAIGLSPQDANSSLRFSLSKYTTKQEIKHTIKIVKESLSKLRKISPLWN